MKEKTYQHKLFGLLTLCVFFYGQSKIGDRFINIDEAQDISEAELDILKRALGSDCTFNLYGDTGQNIYGCMRDSK